MNKETVLINQEQSQMKRQIIELFEKYPDNAFTLQSLINHLSVNRHEVWLMKDVLSLIEMNIEQKIVQSPNAEIGDKSGNIYVWYSGNSKLLSARKNLLEFYLLIKWE